MGFSYYGYEPKEKDMFGQDKVWYDSKAASKTVMFVIENGKTYNAYAAWKEIPVTKTIRYYDGEELLKEQTFTAGTAVTIGGMTKTIEGKEFKGWATTAGGDVVYQAGDTPTLDDDLNLYAVWEDVKPDVEQVTITYHDGDKIVDTQTVDKGTKVTVLDLLQTRTVRTFLGWATEPEGEAVYKPGKELTVYENMDLYAVWKVEEENPNPEDPEKTSLPSMEKKILVTNGEETTEHDEISGMPGDTVEFVLKSNVPQNLFAYVTDWTKTDGKVHADGKYDLDIHDDLDGKYVIDMDTVAVKIGGVPLGKDFYTVSSGDELDGHGVESHVCDFHVTLDLIDLFNKEQLFETDVRNATPITVTYSAKLQESVGNGAHCNYAWVTYPDGTGVIDPSKILIDSALVHVFDLKIVKSDSADDKKFLGGAEFELRDSNTKDAKVLASGITAENTGELDFKNLVAGTYYLYETKAPTGYICMTDPIEVTIAVGADGNHVITKTVTNGKAPSTGGTGTMIYIVAGAVLTSAAFAVLAARKKEQNA